MKIGGRPLRYIQRVPCTNPVAVARVGHQFPTPHKIEEVIAYAKTKALSQDQGKVFQKFGIKNK